MAVRYHEKPVALQLIRTYCKPKIHYFDVLVVCVCAFVILDIIKSKSTRDTFRIKLASDVLFGLNEMSASDFAVELDTQKCGFNALNWI